MRHKRTVHLKENMQCDNCLTVFTRQDNLNRHNCKRKRITESDDQNKRARMDIPSDGSPNPANR